MHKPILVLTLLAAILGSARGEDQTLFKAGEPRLGGFVGPMVRFSPVNGSPGAWFGMRGGIILNSAFSIGVGGYGLWTTAEADQPDTADLMVGVGGVIFEAAFPSQRVVHGTVSLLVGGGHVGAGRGWAMGMGWGHGSSGDRVFVLEPEVDLEVNVTPYFRLCPGVSYRWLSGSVRSVESDWDVSGISGNLMFKFGRF